MILMQPAVVHATEPAAAVAAEVRVAEARTPAAALAFEGATVQLAEEDQSWT